MRRIAKSLLRVVAGLFVIFLVLGFVPTRGLAVEYAVPNRVVNCGSFFISNEWSGDPGCEKSILARMAWIGGALAVALLLAVAAGVLVIIARDLEHTASRRAVTGSN